MPQSRGQGSALTAEKQSRKTCDGVIAIVVMTSSIALSNINKEREVLDVIPCVVIDHNSKTAIVYKVGRKFVYLIPMKSGKLTVTKLTMSAFDKRGYSISDTPVSSALVTYLRHSGGHTQTAKQALESIREAVWE